MSLKEGYKKTSKMVFKAPVREKKSVVVNGIDLLENVPPRTENEVGQRGTGTGGDSRWLGGDTFSGCNLESHRSAGLCPHAEVPGHHISLALEASRSAVTTEHPKGATLSS